jgi:hypothetical protein
MIIKKINPSTITADDIELYKSKISKLKGEVFNSNDIGMDKRIVSVRVIGDDELILVNPEIVDVFDKMILYYEVDTRKSNKLRKTIRHRKIHVQTDNLGIVEFKPTNEKDVWESLNDLMNDVGLKESVAVQRAIDAINGIDITNKERAYTQTIVNSPYKYKRNDKVMMKSLEGETVFVKYKNATSYIEEGYQIL